MTSPTSHPADAAPLDVVLVPTRPEQLAQLASWFPTERACREWGGPRFRFPFDDASFLADTRYDELPSYSLQPVGSDELLGFGQYYPRAGCCHLARLAIAPLHRGRRLGTDLVNGLAARGRAELGVTSCSLFVLASNAAALRLYERLGFTRKPWPADAPQLDGGLYLVRDGAISQARESAR